MAGWPWIRWQYDVFRFWPKIAALVPHGADILEVGTWKGASALRWLRLQPSSLILVDPYRHKGDDSWEGKALQDELEQIRIETMQKVARADLRGVHHWLREFSTEAALLTADDSLDLVYIDGDHSFSACKEDLEAWWPKLRHGGFLLVDDHIKGRWWGDDVIRACAEFQPAEEWDRVRMGRWLVIFKWCRDA